MACFEVNEALCGHDSAEASLSRRPPRLSSSSCCFHLVQRLRQHMQHEYGLAAAALRRQQCCGGYHTLRAAGALSGFVNARKHWVGPTIEDGDPETSYTDCRSA